MLAYSLMLLTILNGQVYVDELDSGLTRSECIEAMVEMNGLAHNNESVVCYAESE